MNAQRLLKLLAVISIAATAVAVVQWYVSGLPPSPLMLKLSAGAFSLALAVAVMGQDTRPRIMLRFLAAIFALIGVIALVTDLSRSGGFTTLSAHLSQLAPSLLTALQSGIERTGGSFAWSVAAQLLSLPTFLAFGLLAALAGFASRPRERLSIYVN